MEQVRKQQNTVYRTLILTLVLILSVVAGFLMPSETPKVLIILCRAAGLAALFMLCYWR